MTAKRVKPQRSDEFQIFPPLSSEQFLALKTDIAEHGVLVAVEVDQTGRIVDGHHRVRAWNELRTEGFKVAEYERKVRHFASDDERLERGLRLNQRRRHLTSAQRQEVAAELQRRGWSARRIADELHVGKSTVARDLSTVPNGTVEKVLGKDGKWRLARRTPTVAAFSAKEEQRAIAAYKELGRDLPTRHTRVGPLERRAKAKRPVPQGPPDGISYERPTGPDDGPDWKVQCADLLSWDLDDESVNLIVTDPPYNKEGIERYRDLSNFAQRVLVPGGLCIAYVGKYFFAEAINLLLENLDWVWMGAVIQTSKPSRIYAKKMVGEYRPFAIASKGPYTPERWMHDVIVSEVAPKKELHPWEQALGPVKEIIQMAAKPTAIICDPFLGSGTTGVAALTLGHSFLGCEIDPRTAREANNRLLELSTSTVL